MAESRDERLEPSGAAVPKAAPTMAGQGLGVLSVEGVGFLNEVEPGEIRIDHIGVAVKDLGAALRVYQLLGLRSEREETVAQERVRTAMLPAGASRIELLEPTTDDSVIGRFLARRGEGLHHVALRVRGLDARFEELRAAGVRLASESPQVGAGGHRYFFVHPESACGVLLELVEEAE